MDLTEFNAHRHVAATKSGEVGYVDFGSGRPVLLIHGLGTNGYLWRNLIAELRGEYRLIAPDFPGHGASPANPGLEPNLTALAQVIEDFLEALGLDQVDLVSNDTGGAITQIFAARHPQRLATLTLTNCEAHDNIPNEEFRGTVELARAGQLVGFAAKLTSDYSIARSPKSLGANYEDPAHITDELIHTYLGSVSGTPEAAANFQRLLAGLNAEELLAAEPGLRRLTVPTLIVWGTADLHFEVSWAHYLRGLIPGAYGVVELEGAKLHFPDERAAQFAPILRDHWAKHPAPVPVDA